MAFTLPTFNLTCNVWDPAVPIGGPPSRSPVCNLAFTRRSKTPIDATFFGAPWDCFPMFLMVPKLTDLRGRYETGANMQTVEVPAGSGRYYWVAQVDDVGKGFANEYRVAMIIQKQAFPVPIP